MFHSHSIGSPTILSEFQSSWDDWTIQIFVHLHLLMKDSRKFYQNTVQDLELCRPLCTEDWWIVFHQSETNTSLKKSSRSINCFHSIDRNVFRHQFYRFLEHLFHCDVLSILDGTPLVWIILSHEFRWFQMLQTCTFSTSKNVFRRFL